MKRRIIHIVFGLFLGQVLLAQNDSIQKIEEVVLYSPFNKNAQAGYTVTKLNDSILKLQNQNLTTVLAKQVNLYFKEYGYGMLSSISLRGSNASHTGVYWNGIPVNSSLNGQTDFNTFNSYSYNSISIRRGGSSAILGSGAIGGAINLENQLHYQNNTTVKILLNSGSYDTYATGIDVNHSTKILSLNVSGNYMKSENDYPYLNTDLYNDNAAFENYVVNVNLGYKIDIHNSISVKNQLSNADRNLSATVTAASNANLKYTIQSNLFSWKYAQNSFNSIFKIAYLSEDYKYLFDKNNLDAISDNTSHKWLGKYDVTKQILDNVKLLAGVNYELLKGEGTNISNESRNRESFYIGINHLVTDKWSYSLLARKEWQNNYRVPILYSFGTSYKWNKYLSTKMNVSSNYRVPTLNDLYWNPGGNPDLEPEYAKSIEISNTYTNRNFYTNLTFYRTNSDNLIQWMPTLNNIWQPVNIQEVLSYGLEYQLKYKFHINNNNITTNFQYSYTISEDENTGKQLIYIPFHLLHFNLDYQINSWNISSETSFNGGSYTTTSNSEFVSSYWVENFTLSKTILAKKIRLEAVVNNLFNREYQIIKERPMPNRNYKLTITIKF